jgi:hypothetical protein
LQIAIIAKISNAAIMAGQNFGGYWAVTGIKVVLGFGGRKSEREEETTGSDNFCHCP